MDLLSIPNFVTSSYFGHLGNFQSLSYVDLPNINTFHDRTYFFFKNPSSLFLIDVNIITNLFRKDFKYQETVKLIVIYENFPKF